jgi:hypothetical protein
MPGCKHYTTKDEAKMVKYEGKAISICEICDDGTFEEVKAGGSHNESFKKTEKIRGKRKSDFK